MRDLLDQLLIVIDQQPYSWCVAGVIIFLCLMILAPYFKPDSYNNNR